MKRTLCCCKRKGMLYLSCISFTNWNKTRHFPGSSSLLLLIQPRVQAVPVPAGRAGLGHAGTHSVCPSHIHLSSLGDPESLLQLHLHLAEIMKFPCSQSCLLRPVFLWSCQGCSSSALGLPCWMGHLCILERGMLLDVVKGKAKGEIPVSACSWGSYGSRRVWTMKSINILQNLTQAAAHLFLAVCQTGNGVL